MSVDKTLELLQSHSKSSELSTLPGPRLRSFGEANQEWAAVETGAVLFDLSGAFSFTLSGSDRSKFLNSFCTNNISRLQHGSGCEAFCANDKGRALAHLFVTCAQEEIGLFSLAGDSESLLKHLQKYVLLDDVKIQVETDEFELFYLTGATASETVNKLMNNSVKEGETVAVELLHQRVLIKGVNLFDQPGYLLSFPKNEVPALWKKCVENGILPAGADCFHTLRIEAGLPLYGIDLTEKNLVHEAARTASAISFTKGCYLGQETVARLDSMGHTNQELRSLRWDGAHTFSADSPLLATESSKPVGVLHSQVTHPVESAGLGLALVRREFFEPGTELHILAAEGTQVPVVVQ